MPPAHGTPLTSSVHSTSAEDGVQNAMTRSEHTWMDDWTSVAAKDYEVMGYSRGGNAIVGYQKSSGHVFAQRQAPQERQPRPMRIESAFIVRAQGDNIHKAQHNQAQGRCSVLTLEEDGGLAWRETQPTSLGHGRHQLWNVRAKTGWTDAIDRFSITSNLDAQLSCLCSVDRPRGIWRGTVLRRLTVPSSRATSGAAQGGCQPQPSHWKTAPNLYEIELGLNQGTPSKTVELCTTMTTLLLGVTAAADDNTPGFFPVSMLWWLGGQDMGLSTDKGATPSTCACTTVVPKALRYMKQLETQAKPKSLTSMPSQPRAAVLMDLKRAVQAVSAVDSTMAIVTSVVEAFGGHALHSLGGSLAPAVRKLHDHERLSVAARARLHASLDDRDKEPEEHDAEGEAATEGEPKRLLKLSFNRTCDGTWDPLVAEFLQSRHAALTPERVNVTRVSYAVGRYVMENLECLQKQFDPVTAAAQCTTQSLGGAEQLEGDVALDGLQGLLSMGSDIRRWRRRQGHEL